MSNGNRKDEKEIEKADIPDVSGGYKPPDSEGYVPFPIGDPAAPYPRLPGGPISRIEPPEKPIVD
jgi:hypothetical protein